VKQRFEAGEHRYEVVRYDGSKARPKGLMEVVKWATIESNAALAISNGGQIIYSKQGGDHHHRRWCARRPPAVRHAWAGKSASATERSCEGARAGSRGGTRGPG
jgi:hypothetical protein